MPVFKRADTQTLYLPSTAGESNEADRAYVKIRSKIYLGDLREVAKIESIVERGIITLSRLIEEWNYTDDNGQLLPITPETLNKLEKVDYEFLDKWANENISSQQEGLSDEEKKTSSATSIPVLTVDDPPSTPQTTT